MTPRALARRRREDARKAGAPAKPSIVEHNYVQGTGAGVLPLDNQELTEEDRARFALRQRRRALFGDDVDLITLPGVQSLSHVTRYIPGGRETFVAAVQYTALNNDPIACQWWDVFRDLTPHQRSLVSFDDVCAAAGIKPHELMSTIVGHNMQLGVDAGYLVRAVFHPKVIEAQMQSAIRIDGPNADLAQRDRMAFLQTVGMAPLPRNTVINVHANASANAKAAAAATVEPTVPNFSDEMSSLNRPRSTVQRQLTESRPDDLDGLTFLQREPVPVVTGDD